MRRAFYLASLLVTLWATVYVPMPLIEYAPGGAYSVPPLVHVTEHPVTPINGDLRLLTVSVLQPSLAESIQAWISPERALQPRANVIPTGVDRTTYFEAQRRQFTRSFEVAAAVGLREAGYDVTVDTAALVAGVLPGGPADGVLQTGDLIRAVDGEPVQTADALVAALRDLTRGQRVPLTIERGDETSQVTVAAGQVADMDHPGLGILVETIANDITLPFPVTLEQTQIGGPSAGMMIALTTYDLVSDEDLAAGRVIAGTGTLDLEGRVGPIGGIEEKVVAAEQAGATVFLSPASQAEAAATAAGPRIRVIPVDTVEGAIRSLRVAPDAPAGSD